MEEKNINVKTIIIIAIGIIAFIAGIIVGFNSVNKDENKDKPKEEIKEEEKNESEEKEEERKIEKLFLDLDIHLKDEELDGFITSSSNAQASSENLIGAMFNTNITDEYKLVYILSRTTWLAFDENYDLMESRYNTKVTLKKTTIEKLAKQVFNEFAFPTNLSKSNWMGGITEISCNDKECTYLYSTFGIISLDYKGYMTNKIEKKDNKVVVSPIYVNYSCEEILDDTNNKIKGNVILKDNYNGTLIKELNNHTFNTNMDENDNREYEEFSKYYSNITKYTYIFNEENVLLSIENS